MSHLYFFSLIFPLYHPSLELSSFFFKRNSISLSLLLSPVHFYSFIIHYQSPLNFLIMHNLSLFKLANIYWLLSVIIAINFFFKSTTDRGYTARTTMVSVLARLIACTVSCDDNPHQWWIIVRYYTQCVHVYKPVCLSWKCSLPSGPK